MTAPFPTPFKTWHNATYAALDPSQPSRSLTGKSAIVTGGAGTIGAATVRAFAAAHIDAVGIVGRNISKLQATRDSLAKQFPKTKFIAAQGDVTKKDSIYAAFKTIRDEVGKPVDILVANAGYLPTPGKIEDSDVDDWWSAFEINVLGSFLSVRAFLPIAATDATVINTSSGLGHVPAMAGVSAYSAAKMGGIKFFEYLQFERPEWKIVNVHPGVVESEMNDKGDIPPMDHEDLPGTFNAWLATSESDFLKGRYVWVNWDIDELKEKATEISENPFKFTSGLGGWPQ